MVLHKYLMKFILGHYFHNRKVIANDNFTHQLSVLTYLYLSINRCAPTPTTHSHIHTNMIEVVLNDRLGKKVRVKCNEGMFADIDIL